MAVNVIMPSLGFDMTEGALARWLVKEGERIEKGQAIAEIETEKATVEIEATVSGVLAKIAVDAGQTVPVGTVIGTIAVSGEKTPGKAESAGQPGAEVREKAPLAEEAKQPGAEVREKAPLAEEAKQPGAEVREKAPPAEEAKQPGAEVREKAPSAEEAEQPGAEVREKAPAAEEAEPPAAEVREKAPPAEEAKQPGAEVREKAPPAEAEKPTGADVRVKASPVARRMAEEAGLDLSRIQGTGPGGRIMERDIQSAVSASQAPSQVPRTAPEPPSRPERESVPLSRMRLATAHRMTASKTTAPHFYVTVEIDMDEAVRMREQLNRLAPAGEKVSVNDFVVAAAARALARFPGLNASFRDGVVETHTRVNIGVAVALDDGLITPVLRDADTKTLKTIAAESKGLADRARAGKLRADDLGFGTFTVSNLGMFDVDEFIAIINPPEAAILAVGAVTRRPVAAGAEVRIGSVMKATLSVDHRVADGAMAGRFLQELRKFLENPVNLLTG